MKLPLLLATCSLLALTACGGSSVKETLGIGARAPDEFKVVARPPLSVPPQFNLRPPSTNAASPTLIPADKQAKSIITGSKITINDEGISNVDTAVTPVDSSPLPSASSDKKKKNAPAESEFMKNIGVDKADPKVRDELIQQKIEAQEKKEESSWWGNVTNVTEKKDTLVDAKKEAQRIKTNKEKDKPVTEGETPEVKDKDHGVIGNIFGW